MKKGRVVLFALFIVFETQARPNDKVVDRVMQNFNFYALENGKIQPLSGNFGRMVQGSTAKGVGNKLDIILMSQLFATCMTASFAPMQAHTPRGSSSSQQGAN